MFLENITFSMLQPECYDYSHLSLLFTLNTCLSRLSTRQFITYSLVTWEGHQHEKPSRVRKTSFSPHLQITSFWRQIKKKKKCIELLHGSVQAVATAIIQAFHTLFSKPLIVSLIQSVWQHTYQWKVSQYFIRFLLVIHTITETVCAAADWCYVEGLELSVTHCF